MKAVVFTLGCKVNECESDSLIFDLKKLGYEVSDKLEYADVYIVNTCAVTKEAEKKSRQTVSRVLKLNPSAKIIFTGCACEKDPKAFSSKNNVTLVTGTFGKNKLVSIINELGEHIEKQGESYEEFSPVNSLKTRTYIKVEDGCNNFCSYCIIPYLRGRVRSRSYEGILSEPSLYNSPEVVINGINLSAYNYDGTGLTGLIKKLKDIPARIRLGSLEVNVITEELLKELKNLKDFAFHFHLSLQSGSDKVLNDMNRKYTTSQYIEKVKLIREYFPDAGITTDVIAGYPTETEKDFSDSMKFIKEVEFSDIHPFTFSPREKTKAYKLKDLPFSVKKARTEKLIALKEELKTLFFEKEKGKAFNVIAEEEKDGYVTGYTENYIKVYIEKSEKLTGKKVKIRILDKYLDGVKAEII